MDSLSPFWLSDSQHRVAMHTISLYDVNNRCRSEWVGLFEQNGLKVNWSNEAPMDLLEPRRVLRDEGLMGSLRIAFNMVTTPVLRQRILAMRWLFRKYGEHLGAISLVGQREPGNAWVS